MFQFLQDNGLKKWIRHGLFYTLVAGWFILNVPVSLMFLCTPQRWMVNYAPWVCVGFVRIATWTLGISYQVHGISTPITGACVVASNHQSPWETLAYFDIVRNPTFLLKESLLNVPLVGSILRKLGMVPVARGLKKSRNADILTKAGQVLQQGRPIVVFPEGTRVAPGAEPRPYRSGYQKIASHWNVPIIHLHIDSGVYWPARQWWKKPGVIQVFGHYGECQEVGCTRRRDSQKTQEENTFS
jgi:1-acyl-sn-glycerol-3-phosphate acyltransferase